MKAKSIIFFLIVILLFVSYKYFVYFKYKRGYELNWAGPVSISLANEYLRQNKDGNIDTESMMYYFKISDPLTVSDMEKFGWHLNIIQEGDSAVLYEYGFDGDDDRMKSRVIPFHVSFFDNLFNADGDVFFDRFPIKGRLTSTEIEDMKRDEEVRKFIEFQTELDSMESEGYFLDSNSAWVKDSIPNE